MARTRSTSLARTSSTLVSRSNASATQQGKSRAYDSVANQSRGTRFARGSTSGHGSTVDLTLAGVGDHLAGVLHLGRDSDGPSLYGDIFYHGDHDYSYYPYAYPYAYPYPYYSYLYTPAYYYAYPYYEPYYYGLSYTSYLGEPYAYNYYDVDVYTLDQASDDGIPYDSNPVGPPAYDNSATGSAGAYSSSPGATGNTLVNQGMSAFAAGDADEARRLFARAMLADMDNGYPKLLYALANVASGDYEVAATALRRAILTTPELIEHPLDVRTLYKDESSWQKDRDALARYVSKHPQDHPVQLLLGYLYLAGGEPAAALPVLQPVVKANPGDDVAALLRDAALRAAKRK